MFKKRGQNEGSIRQRKDGKYEVRITAGIDFEKGTVKRVSFYADTKTAANKILKEEAYKFSNCNYVDVAKMTTYQYLKRWLKTYVKNTVKDSTYISYEGYVENHFKNTIGEISLKKLNTHTIQELYNYKTEMGLSAKTIRNMNSCLHKALSQAVKENYLFQNPCGGVQLPKNRKKRVSIFSHEECNMLIRESYNHRYGVFIRLTLATGLRLGELLGLRWQDIDLYSGTLHVNQSLNRLKDVTGKQKTRIVIETPKTECAIRSIPLPEGAIRELILWKKQQDNERKNFKKEYRSFDMVVTQPNGYYIEPRTFKDHYNKMLKEAKIPHHTFHSLRHTFVTIALEEKMDIKTVSAIAGHSSVSFTLDTYGHVLEEHKRESMKLMNKLYIQDMEQKEHKYAVSVKQNDKNSYIFQSVDFPEIQYTSAEMLSGMNMLTQNIKQFVTEHPYKIPIEQINYIPQTAEETVFYVNV